MSAQASPAQDVGLAAFVAYLRREPLTAWQQSFIEQLEQQPADGLAIFRHPGESAEAFARQRAQLRRIWANYQRGLQGGR